MPVWLYFLVFCTASVLFALGMARWFRFLRDEDELERRHARDWHG